ncbi:MAG: DNA polymerase IV [Brumimicrobium sp.]|nr:DNA polymerase IV [Brumimicrobium sp.]
MGDKVTETVQRKIIHIDMDAFYASVEQRDNPELRGKPLAVGGSGGRGVIAAANYEARKYGVRSAMPAQVALRKCPTLLFVKPDFEKYKSVSREIRSVFERYTSLIEPLSLDEAFLDVTYTRYQLPSATLIAQEIKNDISNELNLIASAGVSYNKFLAKMASDEDKPDGLFVITPKEGPDYIKQLPIERFYGVGKVTSEKMHTLGIFRGADLLRYNLTQLQGLFGKSGEFLYQIARGLDDRPVVSDRVRKSIGSEMTFSSDIIDDIEIMEKLSSVFEKWWERYERIGIPAKTLTVKIKTSDFRVISRSFTEDYYLEDKEYCRNLVFRLFEETERRNVPIRLMGVSISGLKSEKDDGSEGQLTIRF